MSRVQNDPDQIDRFVRDLAQFRSDLESRVSQLERRFGELGEVWRDAEYARFAADFRQAVATLKRFSGASAQIEPKLRKKAAALRQYLNG